MGTFLCLEGIDSVGKNTHTRLLRDRFERDGKRVTLFSFPNYETVTGKILNDYLLKKWIAVGSFSAKEMQDINTALFQCCHLANKVESLDTDLIQGSYLSKDVVYIADRYIMSGLAYGKAYGLDIDWLLKIHRIFPKPEISIFLDISVEESFKRRPDRRDEYEKNSEMLERVRQSYKELFQHHAELYGASKYVVIDASGTVEETHGKILDIVLR